jgi:hypothetical protein
MESLKLKKWTKHARHLQITMQCELRFVIVQIYHGLCHKCNQDVYKNCNFWFTLEQQWVIIWNCLNSSQKTPLLFLINPNNDGILIQKRYQLCKKVVQTFKTQNPNAHTTYFEIFFSWKSRSSNFFHLPQIP